MAKLQKPSLGAKLRPPFPAEGGQENNGRGTRRSLALLSTQHAKEKRKRKVDLRGGGAGAGVKEDARIIPQLPEPHFAESRHITKNISSMNSSAHKQ